MKLIYEPKGRAREYSPLALNLYDGCDHGCLYCYVPRIRRQAVNGPSKLRPGLMIDQLDREAKLLEGDPRQILLSFFGDPYCTAAIYTGATHEALEILLRHHLRVAVLTKAGTKCMEDLDLFRRFGKYIKVGATLTMASDRESLQWEPRAALPMDRVNALRTVHDAGVPTWASLEPVLNEGHSLAIMLSALNYVDEFRLGVLNHFARHDADYPIYLANAVEILRGAGKRFYVKRDLQERAPGVELRPEETDPDRTVCEP
jgi:DNA repair photolyase